MPRTSPIRAEKRTRSLRRDCDLRRRSANPGHAKETVSQPLPGQPPQRHLITVLASAQIEKIRSLGHTPVYRHPNAKIDSPSLQKCLESDLEAVRNPIALAPDGLKSGLQTLSS